MAANSSRPLDIVEQTSKTILFEKFSSEVVDLRTLIENEGVDGNNDFLSNVDRELAVSSFEEFVKKFMPTVWEWIETSNDPNMPVTFCYSLEQPKDKPNAHPLNLDKNEYYSMVMKLYSQKGNAGVDNMSFDYSMVAELLSPKKVLDRAKQLRKNLEYNYSKYLALGEGSKQERNDCVKKINAIRREIVSQYKDSFTGVVKLALADTEQKLLALTSNETSKQSEVEIVGLPQNMPCRIALDDKGELDVQLIEMQDNNTSINNDNNANSELLRLVEEDYDAYGGDSGEYVKGIITASYCSSQTAITLGRDELVNKRNMYTSLYKNSQEHFIRAISSAIEKVLNVKAFFEQASVSAGKRLPAPLIVANCKIDALLDNEVKDEFVRFLREANRQKNNMKIWFAIIPAIGDADFIENVDEPEESLDDIFAGVDTDKDKVRTHDGDELTSLGQLKEVLNIMKEWQITTFFNFRANEKTGFSGLNEKIIENYRSKLESVKGNSYAVFAYPNFTVLPKKKTYIEIGKTEVDGVEQSEYIDIPGIYIDSSYVAAGLVIASQNPDYLAAKFSQKKVKPGYPCVRFDIERKDNRYVMLTKMNREGKVEWQADVEDNISKDNFGFCFCGNTMHYKNQLVNNSFVFSARNMNTEDGQYEPIYKRLTMDFIKLYLRNKTNTNTIHVSAVNDFLRNEAAEWERSAEEDFENNILCKNGDVTETIEMDNGRLKIRFHGGDAIMEIDIDKE